MLNVEITIFSKTDVFFGHGFFQTVFERYVYRYFGKRENCFSALFVSWRKGEEAYA